MEVVIFTGLPASGKSSFYKRRFVDTHVRINLDMLKTRHREKMLYETCLLIKQSCVVDNTNLTVEERAVYISAAKLAGFGVVGYYFRSKLEECLPRNLNRGEGVPEVALFNAASRLKIPSYSEGYDKLYYVRISTDNWVEVEDWIED